MAKAFECDNCGKLIRGNAPITPDGFKIGGAVEVYFEFANSRQLTKRAEICTSCQLKLVKEACKLFELRLKCND